MLQYAHKSGICANFLILPIKDRKFIGMVHNLFFRALKILRGIKFLMALIPSSQSCLDALDTIYKTMDIQPEMCEASLTSRLDCQGNYFVTQREGFLDLTGTIINISSVFLLEPIAVQQNDEFLKALQYFYNFTYILKESEEWGVYNESTREWIGMVRHLLDGEADVGISLSAQLPLRRTAVDFTFSTATFKYVAVFRKSSLRKSEMALLRPFKKSLWAMVLTWCFLMTATISCLQYRSSSRKDRKIKVDWILYPVATVCLRSSHYGVHAGQTGVMVLVLTGSAVAIVLNASYSGLLYSFLSLTVNSASDVLDQTESLPPVFAINDEDVFLFQQKMKAATPSRFWQEFAKRPKLLADYASPETKRHILEGSWLFLVYDWVGNAMISTEYNAQERCEIDIASLPVDREHLGSMIAKGSPYKPLLNYLIIRTKQYGLNDLWVRRDVHLRPSCDLKSRYEPVHLKSVMVAVYALLLGFFISVVLLTFERSVFYLIQYDLQRRAE